MPRTLPTALPCLSVLLALLAAAPADAAPTSFRTGGDGRTGTRAAATPGPVMASTTARMASTVKARGQDPAFDLAVLTRDARGRRTDPLQPDDSLIPGQGPADVCPHRGRRPFRRGIS